MRLDVPEYDVELRRIDAQHNCFRIYGLTVCRTLFGEACLRIVWGRMGNRSLRVRSETFADVSALERRRDELLERRRRHGYEPVGTDWMTLLGIAAPEADLGRRASPIARDIIEAHGLALGDRVARGLVARWQAAATELRSYVLSRAKTELDLEDVSTLAAMYAALCQVA